MSGASLSAEDVRTRLREACAAAGSQQAFAASAGVSPAFVSDVLLGRRTPSDGVLIPLGLKRFVSYAEASV